MRNSFSDDPRDLEIENERLLEETDRQRRLLVAGIGLVTEISEIVRLPLRLSLAASEWVDRVGRRR